MLEARGKEIWFNGRRVAVYLHPVTDEMVRRFQSLLESGVIQVDTPEQGATTMTATKTASKKNTKAQTNGTAKAEDGLSPNQIKVLSTLAKAKGPLTRTELATKTGINKGWSRLLGASTKDDSENGGLEAEGLVKVEKPEDSRGLVYTITAAGRKALEKASK